MMSMYFKIWRIYTPRHSIHSCYASISVHPPSLLEDIPRGRGRACFEMHLQSEVEWTQVCTWRPGSSEFSDVVGNWEIKWTHRCTWWPGSNKVGGLLGGGWSGSDWSECSQSEGSQSGGSQSGGSESGGSESGGSRSGAMCDGSWESIYRLTRNCGNVDNWVTTRSAESWETGWKRDTVDVRMMYYAVYVVCGVCCTQYMQYLVYAVLGVCCTWCMLYLVLTLDSWQGEMERDDITWSS